MAQQGSTQRTGALSQSLGEIANLLSSDPRVAASRARELLKRYPGQEQALLLLNTGDAEFRFAVDAGGLSVAETAEAERGSVASDPLLVSPHSWTILA